MKTGLSRYEQETVINFNEGEERAIIDTFNGRLIRKLESISKQRPEDIEVLRAPGENGAAYSFPKSWIKINTPRVMSDEMRDRACQRLRPLRRS